MKRTESFVVSYPDRTREIIIPSKGYENLSLRTLNLLGYGFCVSPTRVILRIKKGSRKNAKDNPN